MGVSMQVLKVRFRIPAHAQAKCFRRVKEELLAHQHEWGGGRDSSGRRWYRWVDPEKLAAAPNLEALLLAFRWEVAVSPDGSITGLVFEGESLGDDEHLFRCLAPYVEPGSVIAGLWDGETIFRYRFDGLSMTVEEEDIEAVLR